MNQVIIITNPTLATPWKSRAVGCIMMDTLILSLNIPLSFFCACVDINIHLQQKHKGKKVTPSKEIHAQSCSQK